MNLPRAIYLDSIEEQAEEIDYKSKIVRRMYLERIDFGDVREKDFINKFRLSRNSCQLILRIVGPKIEKYTERYYSLTAQTKLLLALRFYGSGNFLTTLGDFCGVSIPTASRAIRDVSKAISSFSKDYIKFESREDNITDLYKNARFPKVIGVIATTHIRMHASPGGDEGESYRNDKGFCSVKVQAVCNAKMNLQDLDARWPGSTRDKLVFSKSDLKRRCENGEISGGYLIGNIGYPLSPYLMTPLFSPTTEAEKLYNECHGNTHKVIRNCFENWKLRFPVLSTGMRISIETVKSVIVACAVLHNIAIEQNDPMPPIDDTNLSSEWDDIDPFSMVTRNNKDFSKGSKKRNKLIQNYFKNKVI